MYTVESDKEAEDMQLQFWKVSPVHVEISSPMYSRRQGHSNAGPGKMSVEPSSSQGMLLYVIDILYSI